MTTTPLDPEYDRFDYTLLPDMIMPYTGGGAMSTIGALKTLIHHAIDHHPRSLQKRIGPSELGTPCDHCLAAKLAGWEQTERGTPWLPTIGTAVHAWLEEQVMRHENDRNAVHTTGRRFLTEERVTVGDVSTIGPISGSCDLFDVTTGTVVDWKIVGSTTLTAAKSGPSETYRRQISLYGKGFEDDGYRVENVSIAYLPRNAVSLESAVWWHDRYDRDLAVQTLTRASLVASSVTALASISNQVRDQWITTQARAEGCYDCARFADRPPTQTRIVDLIG